MKFDLGNKVMSNEASDYFIRLKRRSAFIELKEIRNARSSQLNRYMHLLFAHFAMEYGETPEYVKQYFFKRVVNWEQYFDPYFNQKTGAIRENFKSTADRDSKELTEDIERFRTWSSKEAGIYLPRANEKDFLKEIEILYERYRETL